MKTSRGTARLICFSSFTLLLLLLLNKISFAIISYEPTQLTSQVRNFSPAPPYQCVPNRTDPITLLPAHSNISNVLRDYIYWHRQQRECLLDEKCSSSHTIKVLLSHCTNQNCLGLGDRMRGVYYTFLLAVATRRVFFMEWPDIPFDITCALIPAAIDWRLPKALPPLSEWSSLVWWQCNLGPTCPNSPNDDPRRMPLPNNSTYLNLFNDDIAFRLSSFPFLTLSTRLHAKSTHYLLKNPFVRNMFLPLAMGRSYVFVEGEVMKSLFRPSHLTRARMNEVGFGPNKRYIGAHLRIGEGTKEQQHDRFRIFENSSTPAISARIIKCALLLFDEELPRRLFIASDSSRVKEEMPILGAASKIEVRSVGNGTVMHVSKFWMKKEDEVTDECKRYLDIFADLFFLAEADHIIVLVDSHFSCLAKALSDDSSMTLLEESKDESLCFRPSSHNLEGYRSEMARQRTC